MWGDHWAVWHTGGPTDVKSLTYLSIPHAYDKSVEGTPFARMGFSPPHRLDLQIGKLGQDKGWQLGYGSALGTQEILTWASLKACQGPPSHSPPVLAPLGDMTLCLSSLLLIQGTQDNSSVPLGHHEDPTHARLMLEGLGKLLCLPGPQFPPLEIRDLEWVFSEAELMVSDSGLWLGHFPSQMMMCAYSPFTHFQGHDKDT